MTQEPHNVPWRPLGNTGVHYWLVQRMAKRCGANMAEAADSGALDQEDWVGIVHKCRGCAWTEGCQRWLSHLDEDGTAEPPRECLNADILKALAVSQTEH